MARYINRSEVMEILNKHLKRIAEGNNPKKEFVSTYEEIESLNTLEI